MEVSLKGKLFSLAVAVAISLITPAFAQGQAYPSKPVKVIVPFPPGGATDIFARLIAQKLSATFGQQVVVENRPGAGGNIGSDLVAKAEPDGHTLVMGTVGTHAINPSLYPAMPYDSEKDFAPVAFAAGVPNVMEVHPKSVTAKTVQEFIAEAKARRDPFSVASSGNGTSIHLAAELFKQMTGVDMVHVPYRGSAPALNDLVAGQVQVMFDNLPASIQQIRAGTLRAIAVTSAQRSPALPDVPTVAEGGVPGFEASSWFAFFAPAKTPKEIIDRLNTEVIKAVQTPDLQKRFEEIGGEQKLLSPAELGAFVKGERDKWAKVVQLSGAKPD
jgi:tripartite-type tricarboxylate transporter receptor subunit TctC